MAVSALPPCSSLSQLCLMYLGSNDSLSDAYQSGQIPSTVVVELYEKATGKDIWQSESRTIVSLIDEIQKIASKQICLLRNMGVLGDMGTLCCFNQRALVQRLENLPKTEAAHMYVLARRQQLHEMSKLIIVYLNAQDGIAGVCLKLFCVIKAQQGAFHRRSRRVVIVKHCRGNKLLHFLWNRRLIV